MRKVDGVKELRLTKHVLVLPPGSTVVQEESGITTIQMPPGKKFKLLPTEVAVSVGKAPN